ncbi:DUF4260 family protein [Streptomyces sp. TRM 70361]|uniref:DUF4260 family protein n=1 Tax=Streptomyces sp. TRM 70361 TaxID=3116553 RepID=UPI002E7B6E3B|nr:DUF4260 family protein [Streptomyces sp. TRM 70361]MEE1938955.1 DUF4260 family protein [Streptomyces sp. TRM 70361]
MATGRPLARLRAEAPAPPSSPPPGSPGGWSRHCSWCPACSCSAIPRARGWAPGSTTSRSAPLPPALLAAGLGWDITALTVAGAIGPAHIGLDRVIRAGPKYDHGFAVTRPGVWERC